MWQKVNFVRVQLGALCYLPYYCLFVFFTQLIIQIHKLQWPGNVPSCGKVDPEVEWAVDQNIEYWQDKRRKAQGEYEEEHPYCPEPGEEGRSSSSSSQQWIFTSQQRAAAGRLDEK